MTFRSSPFLAILLALNVTTPCSASLRGGGGGRPRGVLMSAQEIEVTLRESVDTWLRGGNGLAARRLAAIERKTWRTYQALPKNELGRLAPQAVRYLAHNYFAKEHGWLINGLEPHGMRSNASQLHEASVLQDKAPALVEALLEVKQQDRGLQLGDIVAMIAALEHLIFDESVSLLEASYFLNDHSATELVDEASLHEILRSYLLVFEAGDRRNVNNAKRHQAMKRKAASTFSKYQDLVEYETNAVGNYDYMRQSQQNPFVPKRYSFEEASLIVSMLVENYGKWQDTECQAMKGTLMEMDAKGTGRVPLGTFYAQPQDAAYQFAESADYLREAGALDESGSGSAHVLVANYVTGPSNCIASSAYYSVCCINECEGILNELEDDVQAPTASPDRLLSLVEDLSSTTVDAPRELPVALREKLQVVADRNGGEVPLHGRLFSQWLHFAFPNECPYPLSGNDAVLTPSHWLRSQAVASKEERQQHIANTTASQEPTERADLIQWSDDEVLPLNEPSKRSGQGAVRGAMGLVMQLAALGVAFRTAASVWKVAMHGSEKEKAKYDLPFRA